jgi:hypothetical protein
MRPLLRGIAVAALLAGGGIVALPRAASAQNDLACRVNFTANFSPGLSMVPSSGSVTSGGEAGTINCEGEINGQRVTAGGPFGFDGRFGTGLLGTGQGDTCLGGSGTGTYTATVQTTGGPVRFSEAITFTYVSTTLTAGGEGEVKGPNTTGTFTYRPTAGDCVGTPITQFAVDVTARVGPGLFPRVSPTAPTQPTAPPSVASGRQSGGQLPPTGGNDLIGLVGLLLLLLGGVLLPQLLRRSSQPAG